MKNALVTVKGDREGLHIFCEETSSWSKVIAEIKERLSGENKNFFAGASVIIELGNRDLSVKDVSLLWKTFEQCGIKIKGIRTDSSAETSIETKEKTRSKRIELSRFMSRKHRLQNLLALNRFISLTEICVPVKILPLMVMLLFLVMLIPVPRLLPRDLLW